MKNTIQRMMLGAATVLAIQMALPVWPTSAVADTRNAELAGYDAALNKTYRAIIAQLDEQKQNALRQAQRAWIQMRDFDCQWAWADVDARDCLIDRTINREQELRKSYFMATDGEFKRIGH